MIPVCRYGQTWAEWRQMCSSDGVGRTTERLNLEEGEGVTALTGQSSYSSGGTHYLDVTTSTGRRWRQGYQEEEFGFSLRPSPDLGGRQHHLSGSKTVGTRFLSETERSQVLCCHWSRG